MATANATRKRTLLSYYSKPRTVGLRAVDLVGDDTLIGTAVVDGTKDIMLFSSEGKAVRFDEKDVRATGRVSKGVRGMRLPRGHTVISMVIPESDGYLLTVSQNGFGKRTPTAEYPTKGRGGKGMKAMQASDRNGPLIGAAQIFSGEQVILISDQGTMVRIPSDQVSVFGRNTQGVIVMRLKASESLKSLARVSEPEEFNDEDSVSEE